MPLCFSQTTIEDRINFLVQSKVDYREKVAPDELVITKNSTIYVCKYTDGGARRPYVFLFFNSTNEPLVSPSYTELIDGYTHAKQISQLAITLDPSMSILDDTERKRLWLMKDEAFNCKPQSAPICSERHKKFDAEKDRTMINKIKYLVNVKKHLPIMSDSDKWSPKFWISGYLETDRVYGFDSGGWKKGFLGSTKGATERFWENSVIKKYNLEINKANSTLTLMTDQELSVSKCVLLKKSEINERSTTTIER